MLIESIVRKTLGLKRHCVKEVKEKDGYLMVSLAPDKRFKLICSHCGSKGPGYDTMKERQWKHVPLWGIPVFLVYSPRRVNCANYGAKVEAIYEEELQSGRQVVTHTADEMPELVVAKESGIFQSGSLIYVARNLSKTREEVHAKGVDRFVTDLREVGYHRMVRT